MDPSETDSSSNDSTQPPTLRNLTPIPDHRGPSPTAAVDIKGRRLSGQRVRIEVRRPGSVTLLLFLSAHCDGCLPLWELVRDPGSHGLTRVRVLAVVEPRGWRQRIAIARQAGAGGRRAVVRSPEAFESYRVHAPFFVLVEGDGPSVLTEGIAWSLDDTVGHLTRALARSPRSAR